MPVNEALNGEPLALETFLPYRLSVLANRISRDLSRLYSEQFDLSIAEWRVMAVLGRYPGVSADEVCRHTEMDKVAVSRAVSRLRTKRFVSRRTHQQDRRRSVLSLSVRGKTAYARIVPLARDYEKTLLTRLSSSTVRGLENVLRDLDRATNKDPR